MPVPAGAEFYGIEFRVGAYLPMFPPGVLADRHDVVLPILDAGRVLLGGTDWEIPSPENADVFVERLERAGLLSYDPLVDDVLHGEQPQVAKRTAQRRFLQAVGVPRRRVLAIERACHAARLLRAGTPVATVAARVGYYDQPHLTRALSTFLGHTPGEIAHGTQFLDL